MNIDLQQLNSFVTAAEMKNLSGAAQTLGVSQSTLSRQLGDLESKVGAHVFLRQNGDLKLTHSGKALHDEALVLLRKWSEWKSELKIEATKPPKAIRMMISDYWSSSALFGQFIERISCHAPDVAIEIIDSPGEPTLNQLLEGEGDFLLSAEKPEHKLVDSCHMLEAPPLAILPTGHRLLDQNEIKIEDLAGENLIQCSPDTYPEAARSNDILFESEGILPNYAAYTQCASASLAMIESGNYCGFCSGLGLPEFGFEVLERPIYTLRKTGLHFAWRKELRNHYIHQLVERVKQMPTCFVEVKNGKLTFRQALVSA